MSKDDVTEPLTARLGQARFRPAKRVELEFSGPPVVLSPPRRADGTRYPRALLIARNHGIPVGAGLVDVPTEGMSPEALSEWFSRVQTGAHAASISETAAHRGSAGGMPVLWRQGNAHEDLQGTNPPLVSVVLATKGRAQSLERCLASIANLDYPNFEVVVVENGERVLKEGSAPSIAVSDSRFRLAYEPFVGLSRARNTGIVESRGSIIAFTDDDVEVDPQWLKEIVHAFSVRPDVAGVTGMTLPGELETAAQDWFEQFGGHTQGRGFQFEVFDPRTMTQDPLFPSPPFGAGVNMAFRAEALKAMNGFDPCLGTGTVARAAEDTDLFYRLLASGRVLVYWPPALVFHYHRRDYPALQRQVEGYGVGITAFYTKWLVSRPATALHIAALLPRALWYFFSPSSGRVATRKADYPKELGRRQMRGMLLGPIAYLRSRSSNGWTTRSLEVSRPLTRGHSCEDRGSVCVVGSGSRFLGGISYYTDRLSAALAERHRVVVILMRTLLPVFLYPGRARVGHDLASFSYGGSEVLDGVDWTSIPSVFRARSALGRWQPDVVLFQWWTGTVLHNFILMALKARALGAKVVIEFHEVLDTAEDRIPPARAYVRMVAPWLMRLVDAFVVHSQADVEAVRRRYALDGVPFAVIPHGPYDRYGSPPVEARQDPVVERPFTLLFFGLLRPYKGVDTLLKAFDGLSPEEAEQYHLLIVGETWQDWSAPETLIRQSRYRERIEFVNRYVHDDEVGTFFGRADAVVLPYYRSSASGPLSIAMSLGLPLVTTFVGGLPDAVDGYGGAILVPPKDPEALRAAFGELLPMRGRRFATTHTWKATVERFGELFREIGALGDGPPGSQRGSG